MLGNTIHMWCCRFGLWENLSCQSQLTDAVGNALGELRAGAMCKIRAALADVLNGAHRYGMQRIAVHCVADLLRKFANYRGDVVGVMERKTIENSPAYGYI